MFDLSMFADAAVGGVPLLFVVLGLVQWAKELGLEGNLAIRLVSMGIGLVFGGGFMLAEYGVPADFAGWFGLAVYGIALGLIASGIYDVGQDLSGKI